MLLWAILWILLWRLFGTEGVADFQQNIKRRLVIRSCFLAIHNGRRGIAPLSVRHQRLVEKGLSPIGMTISGGDSINWAGRYVTVPKMRLLTGLLSMCYRGELEIAKSLPDYSELGANCRTSARWQPTAARARHGAPDEVMTIS